MAYPDEAIARQIGDRVEAFVRDVVAPYERDPRLENHGPSEDLVKELRDKARAAGVMTPHILDDGSHLSQRGTAYVLQKTGLSPLGPVACNTGAPDEGNMFLLGKAATPEQHERFLKPLVSGEARSAFFMTEPVDDNGAGSDPSMMKTTAKQDGNHWVINGRKTFITGGMTSDFFVVGARTGGDGLAGISLFFVETDTAGFSRSALNRKMGWWCSDQATLYFDDLRVPAENLMGEQDLGFIAIMENFNLERVALIAGALGMMRVCLAESIDWAQSRQTFGKPLIRHQVIRHKIADMSARIDALEAYLNQICWIVNSGEMPVAEICKAKFFATRALAFCASEAIQILGGAGYLRGNPVERIYREVKVMAIGGGSEEIMRDLAVRQMGL